MAGGKFKKRLANHTQSIQDIKKRKVSRLSEAIWDLKDQGREDFNVKWSVIAKEKGYNRKSRKSQLCILKKVEIMRVIRK